VPPVALVNDPREPAWRVRLEKHRDGRLKVALNFDELHTTIRLFTGLWKRLPTMIRLFALTDPAVATAEADFGDAYEGDDRRSSPSARTAAVPCLCPTVTS
jgi:hypothetical protein